MTTALDPDDASVLCGQAAVAAAEVHAATARLVRLLGEVDRTGAWQGVGLRSLGHWASIELGIDAATAMAHAALGRRLAELAQMAAAADAGQLGWPKLRLLARVIEPATETRWVRLAQEMSVGQLARVVNAYRRASDTDRRDYADDHRDRRGIWLFDEPDGLVRVTGLLEPDDAAILRAALATHTELLRRTDPPTPDTARTDDAAAGTSTTAVPARDHEVDPTLQARHPAASQRVDALVSLARAALARPGRPRSGDDVTEVLLVVDADALTGHADVARCHLHGGPPVSTATARRLACDARIRPLLHQGGRPLDVGRAHRLVSRAQRRALRFRDGPGCAFPGCAASHVDAHHLHHWVDGGATDLDNLVTLCRHHHRLLHEGAYMAAVEHGRPTFRRPDGTPIAPPPRSPLDHHRRHRRPAGITRHTAVARSGGAPHWSPQHALDALLSRRWPQVALDPG